MMLLILLIQYIAIYHWHKDITEVLCEISNIPQYSIC